MIPKSHPVQPLKPGQQAKDRATCGTCGRSWDDSKATSMTPAPAGRCPFEDYHDETAPRLRLAENSAAVKKPDDMTRDELIRIAALAQRQLYEESPGVWNIDKGVNGPDFVMEMGELLDSLGMSPR